MSRYRPWPGVSGVLLGTQFPQVKGPANRMYMVGVNAGDTGPVYWHWIAGMGTPEAIRYWVLSDVRNVVRGKPKRMGTVRVEGRAVVLWRFPPHPAGGQFGGHVVAITRSGPYQAFASVHGYDTARLSARMASALARTADAARGSRTFRGRGVTLRYPRGWLVTGFSRSNAPSRMAITSYPVPKTAVEGDCGGIRVIERLPDDGVALLIIDYGANRGRFPPRPTPLTLADGRFAHYECFGPSTMLRFSLSGRGFQAHVAAGSRASRADIARALAILSSMAVRRT